MQLKLLKEGQNLHNDLIAKSNKFNLPDMALVKASVDNGIVNSLGYIKSHNRSQKCSFRSLRGSGASETRHKSARFARSGP